MIGLFKNIKKLSAITLASAMIISSSAQAAYLPLRSVFEGNGYDVLWDSAAPGEVTVKTGSYSLKFKDGTNTIECDEGIFQAMENTYMENGTTYISEDVPELCRNLSLYHNAIIDSMQADEDELLPLVPIDKSAEKVLVGTWHKYPQSYPDGAEIDIKYGDVWVFTEKEIREWGRKNGRCENMTLRAEQLIGIKPQSGKTHFSLLWVNPDDLYRPGADSRIDTDKTSLTFPENTEREYIDWFNSNIISSYYPHNYPWTRLGYTYDWADNGTEYGLSEYVLKNGSKATVEKTYTTEEFFDYITSVDYADKDNWAYWNEGDNKKGDLFIVCPTVDMGKSGNFNADISNEKYRKSFTGALNMELGIYNDELSVYAPYYRQATFPIYSMGEEEREQYLEFAYEDIKNAFLYYAENTDKSRPLVLAGFSQGSDMVIRLMKDLFDNEEYKNRLAAAYCIGWKLTEDEVKEYPQLKPAKGEKDTGVIITFNSEDESITESLLVGENEKTYAINPLNWRTDSQKADKSENLGACFTDYSGEITKEISNLTGTYIDENRGTLKVTDISPSDYPGNIFPDGIYHLYDYQFFYRNLQENVNVRLNEYINQR